VKVCRKTQGDKVREYYKRHLLIAQDDSFSFSTREYSNSKCIGIKDTLNIVGIKIKDVNA
jgi:hypothetical protein